MLLANTLPMRIRVVADLVPLVPQQSLLRVHAKGTGEPLGFPQRPAEALLEGDHVAGRRVFLVLVRLALALVVRRVLKTGGPCVA